MDDIPLLITVVILARVMTMLLHMLCNNITMLCYYKLTLQTQFIHNNLSTFCNVFFCRSFNTSDKGVHHTSLHGSITAGENTQRTHISPWYLTKHELITSAHMSSVRTNQLGLGNRESIWKLHQYLHWHHTYTRHSHIFQTTWGTV